MMRLDNRTLVLVALILFFVILIVNPGGINALLATIQSIVFIALGIVATLYLWKRL